MEPFDQPEFEALRAEIRERGSTRVVLFYVGIAVWAALTVATTAVIVLPVAALLPLLVLAAGFEATASLHFGERTPVDSAQGRALRPRSGRAPDALFSVIYVLAGVANFLPVALTGQTTEMIAIGALHALFVWRVLTVRRAITAARGAVREPPLPPG
jgi:hypothetical protein